MAETRPVHVGMWICVAASLLLLTLSLTGTGTMMGGVGWGWMMVGPLALLGAVVYIAFRWGRAEGQLEKRDERK